MKVLQVKVNDKKSYNKTNRYWYMKTIGVDTLTIKELEEAIDLLKTSLEYKKDREHTQKSMGIAEGVKMVGGIK